MFDPSYHYYAQIAWAFFKSQNKDFTGTIDQFLLKFKTERARPNATEGNAPATTYGDLSMEDMCELKRASILARFGGGVQRTPGMMR